MQSEAANVYVNLALEVIILVYVDDLMVCGDKPSHYWTYVHTVTRLVTQTYW